MTPRREFVRNSGIMCFGLALGTTRGAALAGESFLSQRPDPAQRRFISQAVEDQILAVQRRLKDPELAWMFGNCFPNTLDTTVTAGVIDGRPDTFVITGDIDAMWLRDSSAQVWPYLPLIKKDPALETLIAGVINRQARCVLLDPYANAFYADAAKVSTWQHDLTAMKPGVHERKWEVDSLCYVIRLAHGYWKAGGDAACFDPNWLAAARAIVRTFKEQQRKDGVGPYRFQRITDRPFDTAAGTGYGNLAKPNGLICSVFRPSDDATVFPYLIPANFFAVVSLRQIAELVDSVYGQKQFAAECRALADEVEAALRRHAVIEHPDFGRILAYEIDGYGGRYLIDDANVPSLLSMPYLQALSRKDELYRNTRRFLLSAEGNPYYVKGVAAEGISGPHAGRDMIWPMGLMMRAMTADDDREVRDSLRLLKSTHAHTGFMHEAFHRDDPEKFTRKWFAWANGLFGEFILQVLAERPQLLT